MAYRTIGFNLDDDTYQRAVSHAVRQGKTINRIIAELLSAYAGELTSAPVVAGSPITSPSAPTITRPETPTPSTPATSPEPSIPTATVQSIYVVQSGDTLGLIAKKMYGSPNKYFFIQKANNITDPRKIWVGQKLVIPALGENGAETTPSITVTTPTTPTITTPTTPTITTPTTPTIHQPVVPPAVSIPGSTSGKNPRPALRFVGSPNFNRRPNGEISAVVMHATANGSLERVIEWFNKSDAQVSAHYTIGKDGRIVQHVRDEHRAWHAGVSEWKGRKDLNSWAIGIEMVNWNNGEDPYPEAQHQAAVNLVSYLCDKYSIKPELIVAHYDVSPNRKTDPKGYDMDRLRREVAARLADD